MDFVNLISFNFMDCKLSFDFSIDLFIEFDFNYFIDLAINLKKYFVGYRLLHSEISFTINN